MIPKVVDIYSLSKVQNDTFVRAKAAGILGVIHKATEGVSFTDKKYPQRRKMAQEAGLLWGAYHFNYGNDVKAQVKNFISWADPDENTLLVLDYEKAGTDMNIESAVAFMKEIEDRMGKSCAIYSGNRLKETLNYLPKQDQAYMASKKLWLAQYGPKATLPPGFKKYFLWQYTGDGIGPSPHTVDGFENGVDLSVYDGTDEQLLIDWID